MKTEHKEDGLFWLDSGAHSLYNKHAFKVAKSAKFAYYETADFWKYVDCYAAFVKKYNKSIDYYANVDVIHNAELSWKVQKYLENEHGLHPVPVIHSTTNIKWVHKHIEAGYEYIGLGGVALEGTSADYIKWADQVYSVICPAPSHLPIVRTHGFAMTNYKLLWRYPWWSVDSATWTKVGAFGSVLVPHKRNGEFTFKDEPYQMAFSQDSPKTKLRGKHYSTLSKPEKAILLEWLEKIQIPLGKMNGKEVTEHGVLTRHVERKMANLLFFEGLRAALPKWPWPFMLTPRKGFW